MNSGDFQNGDMASSTVVMNFLQAFKPLECSDCNKILGFLERGTDKIFCAPSSSVHGNDCSAKAWQKQPKISGYVHSDAITPAALPLGKSIKKNVSENYVQLPSVASSVSVASAKMTIDGGQKMKTSELDENLLLSKSTIEKKKAPEERTAPPPKASVDIVDFGPSDTLAKLKVPAVFQAQKIVPMSKKTEESAVPVKTRVDPPTSTASTSPRTYLWSNCVYSPNLVHGAIVNVQFPWNLSAYVVVAEADVKEVDEFQNGALKSYAERTKPITSPPVVGEMVVAEYVGDYYRGRVTHVAEDACTVEFVDYGDKAVCSILKILPVDSSIMKYPIYGMTVRLIGIPENLKDKEYVTALDSLVYGNSLILDLISNNKEIVPSNEPFESNLSTKTEELPVAQIIVNTLNSPSESKEKESTPPTIQQMPEESKLSQKVTSVAKEESSALTQPFLWENCTYSRNLRSGSLVSVQFAWDVISLLVVAEADSDDLKHFQNDILQSYVKSGVKPLTRPPVVGEIVMAKYEDAYYRGRVTKMKGSSCRVEFIDYGDKVTAKMDTLLPVNKSIMEYPIYGITVCLSGLPRDGNYVRIGNYEDILFEGGMVMKYVSEESNVSTPSKNPPEVIITRKDGLSLSNILKNILSGVAESGPKEEKEATVGFNRQGPKRNMWDQCKYSSSLCHNAEVQIIHMWTPVIFHIAAVKDEEDITKFLSAFVAYIEKCKIENKTVSNTPVKGEMVIGKYNGDFYRGRVEAVDEKSETCEVSFVDYGDVASCKISELLPLDDTLMKYPLYGMKVHLYKAPNPPRGFELPKSFDDELYPDAPLVLDVVTLKADETLKPNEAPYHEVHLWDNYRRKLLNETVTKVILDAASN